MKAFRPVFVLLHRWFGLTTALFLFLAGITGAIIAWEHELDAWLNPSFYYVSTPPENNLSGLELANRVEAQDPRLRVTYVMTEHEPGHTSTMMIAGRVDPETKQPASLNFNQVAVNPTTGAIQAKRQWGEMSLNRESLLPFIYKLHYTLFLPTVSGIELGVWLMGIIGLVWVIDCCIALWLSFPNWRSWRKSFAFRWNQGSHKLNFDLHRSGGVWIWMLLLITAITSVSMNLERPVARPLIQLFSTLSPDVFANENASSTESNGEPRFTREQVVKLADNYGRQRGWNVPVGGVFYSPEFKVYGVGFFHPGYDHGDVGLGNAWLYFDAGSGQLIGERIPGTGSAGDLFLQAQFPLHSGRIIGVPGRVIISVVGLLVALLSITGVIIWLRKRRARKWNQHQYSGCKSDR